MSLTNVCYVQLNHSRHARNAAKNAADIKFDSIRGKCVFRGSGCGQVLSKNRGRLRRIPVVNDYSLETLDSFTQLDKNVYNHSEQKLRAVDVMVKYCCSSCIYVVTGASTDMFLNTHCKLSALQWKGYL